MMWLTLFLTPVNHVPMGNGKGIARHELKVQYRVIYKVEDQRVPVVVMDVTAQSAP